MSSLITSFRLVIANAMDGDAIIDAARGAAIHPGWGLLPENPSFAAMCQSAGLTFIGPSATSDEEMADKPLQKQ